MRNHDSNDSNEGFSQRFAIPEKRGFVYLRIPAQFALEFETRYTWTLKLIDCKIPNQANADDVFVKAEIWRAEPGDKDKNQIWHDLLNQKIVLDKLHTCKINALPGMDSFLANGIPSLLEPDFEELSDITPKLLGVSSIPCEELSPHSAEAFISTGNSLRVDSNKK